MSILKKLARNHPEDTISDVLVHLFSEHRPLALFFLKKTNYIKDDEDYRILSVARNFTISGKYKPDITFLVRKGEKGNVNHIFCETKITANENRYINKYKRQYAIYTTEMKKNITTLQKKCILLCPSWYDYEEIDNVSVFTFLQLLELLESYFEHTNDEIARLLVDYIRESFEGYSSDLAKHRKLIDGSDESIAILLLYRSKLIDVRKTMLALCDKAKKPHYGGLWKRNNKRLDFHFQIGLDLKGKNDDKLWIAYSFYDREEWCSPIKAYYPTKMIERHKLQYPNFVKAKEYYSNLIDDRSALSIFDDVAYMSTPQKKAAENRYAFNRLLDEMSHENVRTVVASGNSFLSACCQYMERLENMMASTHYVRYEHILDDDQFILLQYYYKRTNSQKWMSFIVDITAKDINQILRIESNFRIPCFSTKGDVFSRLLTVSEYAPEKIQELVIKWLR